MWRVRIAGVFIFLFVTGGVLGCRSGGPVTPAALTVTDALGRTVTLPAPPRRIAIVGRANFMIADAVYTFPEARERVVAISGTPQGNIFQALMDPHSAEKVQLKRDPGPEQIAAVHPDLVLMKHFLAKKLGQSVESLGIPVIYMSLETPDTFRREIKMLGILFNNPDRAREVNAFYQRLIETITQRVGSIPPEKRPAVLVLQHSTKGGSTAYKIPPLTWIQTLMVKTAGGRVAWADATLGSRWTVITLEHIAAWNPDQIYIVDYFGDPREAVQQFTQEETARRLRAVQTHHVFAFPKDVVSWDQPDTRWVLGLVWLARHIHPEVFADVDMTRVYLDFYRTLYGLDESTVREHLMPTITGDWP